MKLLKKHQSLILLAGLPLTVGSFLLIWFFPYIIGKCLRLHWLILILTIILALSPWGKIRLAATGDTECEYTFWIWLRKIISLQLALQILFLLELYFISKILPITTSITPNVGDGLLYLNIAQGLFPWAFFALLAINFGLHAYNRQQDAYFHTTLNPLWVTSGNQPLGMICDILARGVTLLAISGNLLFLSLWCAHLIGRYTWPITTGFNVATLLLVFCIVVLCLLKRTQYWLKQQLHPTRSFTGNTLRIFCIFTLLIFFLNSALHGWQHILIKPPTFLAHIQNYNPQIWWVLFINDWWLLWLPFISIIIAAFSRGYQLRQIIFATLLWPLLSTIILAIYQQHISPQVSLPLPSEVAWLLAMLAGGCVLKQISANKHLSMLILCYLPQATHPKPRSQLKLLGKMPIFMSLVLYVFLPAGLLTLAPLYTLYVFLIILIACPALYSCCLACYRLRQKKTCKL